MKTTLKAVSAAGVLALAAASSSALAAPLAYLTYQQHTGWDNTSWTFTPGSTGMTGLTFSGPTGGAPYPENTYTNMAWFGKNAGESSYIDIYSHNQNDAPTPPSEFTTPGQWAAGELAIITTLTQTNNVLTINAGVPVPNPLWRADAVADLHINAGGTIYSDLSVTSIEFWETLNASNGVCTSPVPHGTVCDDIFRVTAIDFDPITFVHDNYEYTISFELIPGPVTGGDSLPGDTTIVCSATATDPRCAGLTIPEGQIWVFTPEYNPGTSTVYVGMRWEAHKVPEPSIVGLFALGVLGLGVAARRRKEH